MYDTAVRKGSEVDPRGENGIARVLKLAREEYDGLAEARKWEFDEERLTNPFTDTRILVGDPDTEISRMLVGIDIQVGEILLAERLRERGVGVDMVLAHHPEGRALADLDKVMPVQPDIWRANGVPIGFGEAVMEKRMEEIRRYFHAANTQQSIDAARLLGVPLMCCHTPADNSVQEFLQHRFQSLDDDSTLQDVMESLKELPEYRGAVSLGVGPVLFQGDPERRAGKIMVDMTGGTGGPVEALERLAMAGVGTIVGMHMGEDHRKKADELNLNVVIAGHHASDSLGMNLIIDEFERQGVAVVPCSGFMRVSRV
jgi:putative NIF3 family GTP cyclohydrolase 1 type 2